jgi:hypothetical protein
MIGSPAGRGAVASAAAAGRACLAAASAVSAVSAAIAASVARAGDPRRRIAMVDCAIITRFSMLSPIEIPLRACVDQVSDRDLEKLTAAIIHANSLLGLSERSGGESLIYDNLQRKKDGPRLK